MEYINADRIIDNIYIESVYWHNFTNKYINSLNQYPNRMDINMIF